MKEKQKYYFTARWFRDCWYAITTLLTVILAVYGIGMGGADGYLIAFTAGSAAYFLTLTFMDKNNKSGK